jgi:hypothetical protein
MRNELVLDKQGWSDVKGILRKILEWKCIFKEAGWGS